MGEGPAVLLPRQRAALGWGCITGSRPMPTASRQIGVIGFDCAVYDPPRCHAQEGRDAPRTGALCGSPRPCARLAGFFAFMAHALASHVR